MIQYINRSLLVHYLEAGKRGENETLSIRQRATNSLTTGTGSGSLTRAA